MNVREMTNEELEDKLRELQKYREEMFRRGESTRVRRVDDEDKIILAYKRHPARKKLRALKRVFMSPVFPCRVDWRPTSTAGDCSTVESHITFDEDNLYRLIDGASDVRQYLKEVRRSLKAIARDLGISIPAVIGFAVVFDA